MRVVLDTNVILSALLTPAGLAAAIVRHGVSGGFTLLVHPILLDELRRVVRRPHHATRLRRERIGIMINQLHKVAESVGKLPDISISTDPADDFLLAICEAGQADYLVTGDKPGLLSLVSRGRTRIVTLRAFADLVRL